MKKIFIFFTSVMFLTGQIVNAQDAINVAIVNPDHHRIVKFGYLGGECGNNKYYSLAYAQKDDANPFDSSSWHGVGEHPDFLGDLLTQEGYNVYYFDQNSFASTDASIYQILIVQDYLDVNFKEFDKSVEQTLPDLLEKTTSAAFINKLKSYFESGGKVVLVGDAVQLLDTSPNAGKFTLDFGKTINTDESSNSLSSPSNCVPSKWLFIRGNPFCGVNRNGTGAYTIESGRFLNNGTEIASIHFFDGSDLPHASTWSNTNYYPNDGVSLLDVRVKGAGDYVLIGSTCTPPVYKVNVDDVLSNFLGYTDFNGRKIFYIGSDSYFDYDFIDRGGSWHTADSLEMKFTLTQSGKDLLIDFTKYIAAAPTGLTVIDASNGTVKIKWNRNRINGYVKYRIYADTSSRPAQLIAEINSINDTTKTITGLDNNLRYYFQITAVDSAGNESAYSNEVSASPQSNGWHEDFESYSAGSFPSNWVADANATNSSKNYVDYNVSYEGSKSLRLFGSIGGCWGALAYRPLKLSPPYEIELAVRNGNENLSGCHPNRAYIGIRKGKSWTNPGRRFLQFKKDGTITGATDSSIGVFTSLIWYKIKIRYERTSNSSVRLSYWIDDDYLGTEILDAHEAENQMINLDLTVQEGSAWFDDIKIKNFIPNATKTVELLIDSVYAYQLDTISVPINIKLPTNHPGYNSAQFVIDGYKNGLELLDVIVDSSLSGDADWTFAANEKDSLLITWSAGASNIFTSGIFCRLKFFVKGDACTFVPINFESALFDTGGDSIVTFNGGVHIQPRPDYGDIDENGKIQAYDAALILKHLVGTDTLSCQPLSNADVSLDKTVSALDASLILQYGVGIIGSLPYDSSGGSFLASGDIEMKNDIVYPGEIVRVPLYLSNGGNILSFSGSILFNPTDLKFNKIEWTKSLKDFLTEVHNKNGVINFSGANIVSDGKEGVFATIEFTVNNEVNGGETSVVLQELRWNENPVLEEAASANLSVVTGVREDETELPIDYTLSQNYPNPFNPATNIRYGLPIAGYVRLSIYDINGRRIATLVNEQQAAGWHNVKWDGKNNEGKSVSSGIYLLRLNAGDFVGTKKAIYLK